MINSAAHITQVENFRIECGTQVFKRETSLVVSDLAAWPCGRCVHGPQDLWMVDWWAVMILKPSSQQHLQDMAAHLLFGYGLYWLECFRWKGRVRKAGIQTFSRGIKKAGCSQTSLNQLDTLCIGTRFLSLEESRCDEDPVHRLDQESQLMFRESAQA